MTLRGTAWRGHGIPCDLPPPVPVGCPAPLLPVAPYQLVSKMLQRLEESVKADELPNPSVLLAMNLAGATGTETNKWLLQQIQQEAVKRAQKGKEGLGAHPCHGSWSRQSRYRRLGTASSLHPSRGPECQVLAPQHALAVLSSPQT